jgi:hypothetical protein
MSYFFKNISINSKGRERYRKINIISLSVSKFLLYTRVQHVTSCSALLVLYIALLDIRETLFFSEIIIIDVPSPPPAKERKKESGARAQRRPFGVFYVSNKLFSLCCPVSRRRVCVFFSSLSTASLYMMWKIKIQTHQKPKQQHIKC